MRSRGFSLVEVTVAMACTMIVLLASTSLVQISMNSQQNASGKFDGVQQRSEIRDLVFRNLGTSGTSCSDRLGITGKPFIPGTDLQIDPALFPNPNLNVAMTKIYLTNATPAGSTGNFPQFSTQLRVEQRLTRGLASALAPTSLGTVTVVLDTQQKISGCNWDVGSWTPMQVCNSTQGTAPTSSVCYIDITIPVKQTCPTGTQLNTSLNACVPKNTSCYDQNLSDNFDGSVMGCIQLPPSYTVQYPPGYTPPPQPKSPNGTQPPTTITGTTPTGATAAVCQCGSQSMQPGGSQICIQGYSYDDSFFGDGSAYDDMWDVQVCNSAGVLQDANPAHYFQEQGQGVSFNWKIGYACQATGGTHLYNGILYTRGTCY